MPSVSAPHKSAAFAKWRAASCVGLLCAALLTAGLFAGCAHAVNTHGEAVSGGGGSSSGGSSGSGSGNSRNTRGGGGTGGTAPNTVTGTDAIQYSVGERVDFAEQTGTTVSANSSMGYITVTPPANPLPFCEPSSANGGSGQVSWTAYSVTLIVDGTTFTLNFMPNDTQAKAIENVPTGATLSAHAEFTLAGAWGTNGAGTPLIAEAAPTTTQEGSNTVTMYVQYPLECLMSSTPQSAGASISGTAPTKYSNASPTALPAASETYQDPDSGITMYFAGWALSDGGTPVISVSGSIPNNGTYKGHLRLWATYSSCTVSISTPDGDTSPVIPEDDTLALTAVPVGFPSAPSYTWEVVSPTTDAPVTVSAGGVVSPVAGKSGEATIKVTATCGALTAIATQTVTVAALSMPASPVVLSISDTAGTSINASVTGYTSPSITCGWEFPAGSCVNSTGSGGTVTITPVSGGKTTAKATANVNGRTIEKTIDIYVFDVNLSGTGLTNPSSGTYNLVLSTADTSGKTLTASLNGSDMPAVTYTWTCADPALNYIQMNDSTPAQFTVKPRAAGTASFSVMANYNGTMVASATVNVTVAGIVFTTCPKSFGMGGATDSTTLVAEVQGITGTPTNWQWTSDTLTVATLGSPSPSGSGSSVTLTAKAGGKTKITVTADVGGTTVSAEKEISILQLSLACADTSFTQPAGISDPTYKLMLASDETTNTSITPTLAGLPAGDVTYEWTPTTSTTLDATISGNVLKVKPKADTTGTQSFTVRATYDGEYIEKTVAVTVAGLTLTGDDTLEFNSAADAPATANDIALTLGAEGVNISALSDITYTSGTTTVANDPTANTDGCTVTAKKGGTTTITVTATAGGKQLSGTKTITVINLVVKDGTNSVVALTGNTLSTDSQMTLKASLEDLSGASFSWSANPSGTTGKVSFGSSSLSTTKTGANVTITGWTPGTTTVTVTATYKTKTYTKTISFSLSSVTHEVSIDELATFLSGLSTPNRADNPIKLKITGLTTSNWTQIKTILNSNSSKYVDLSETQLPDGITDMERGFYNCRNMVKAPKLPSTVTSLKNCFEDCKSLIQTPDLSACANLQTLRYAFRDCDKLASASAIPASVDNMIGCFQCCSKLSGTIIVKTTNVSEYNWGDCFLSTSSSVTVKVKDDTVKNRIKASSNQNDSVNVVVDSSI